MIGFAQPDGYLWGITMPKNRTIFACTLLAGMAATSLLPERAPTESPTRISFMHSPALVTQPAPPPSTGTAAVERRKDGHYWASAYVNGLKLDLLVDTGASKVVLTHKDARRIGIDTHKLDYDGIANTANGEVRTATLTIDRLRIGAVMVKDVPTIVTQGALDTSLLGMSFLSALDSFEFKGNELILRK